MTKENKLDFDTVIIGSGPAGVSSAFPLVDAGMQVLMLDAGNQNDLSPPSGNLLHNRLNDVNQWKWMLGENFYALSQSENLSPKLRVPYNEKVFENYHSVNKILSNNFVTVGSLMSGGLSNAWGCGVAALDDNELSKFPFNLSDLKDSYRDIANRIGVSGGYDDDMSDYFGIDEWSQEPTKMDTLQTLLLSNYKSCREFFINNGFRLGRSRLALLTSAIKDRKACNLSGNCLWGCNRGSLYSSIYDLENLNNHNNFKYKSGFFVEKIFTTKKYVEIIGKNLGKITKIKAKRVLLAAGTLASTRLALQALNHRKSISMQSCPTAAFLLCLPHYLGRKHEAAISLGQLSFSLDLESNLNVFGSLFNVTNIPVSEFVRYVPFAKRLGIDLLSNLLSSCIAGNIFLPGSMTSAKLKLDSNDNLVVSGGYANDVFFEMNKSRQMLRKYFWKLGALLVPKSFNIGPPGSDIHYSSSLPMSNHPSIGETNKFGELYGASGVYIVDGASLSSLPSKSHTLTIMANADRIAKHIVCITKKN